MASKAESKVPSRPEEPFDISTLNFYQLLEISPTSTKDEIKKAYHIQAKQHHGDKTGGIASDDRMKLLNKAKVVLMDDDERKEYDAFLVDRKEFAVNPSGYIKSGINYIL